VPAWAGCAALPCGETPRFARALAGEALPLHAALAVGGTFDRLHASGAAREPFS